MTGVLPIRSRELATERRNRMLSLQEVLMTTRVIRRRRITDEWIEQVPSRSTQPVGKEVDDDLDDDDDPEDEDDDVGPDDEDGDEEADESDADDDDDDDDEADEDDDEDE
ncbi:MAG: hypothetical protein IT379_33550 [Deltaproteobacteria bacterium]|nr:hypothetical protein [Deltaproteobacteria bacterium]